MKNYKLVFILKLVCCLAYQTVAADDLKNLIEKEAQASRVAQQQPAATSADKSVSQLPLLVASTAAPAATQDYKEQITGALDAVAKNNELFAQESSDAKQQSVKIESSEAADVVSKQVAEQVANSGAPTDEEFLRALKERFPLSSAQIRTFKERIDIAEWDQQEQLKVPRPVMSTLTANLSPGSTPSVIKIASGYVTALVFVDETGEPWSLAGFAVGDKDAYDIKWDQRSNIMYIQSKKRYASTNLIVQMADLNIPVLFTIVSDQSDVFYRLDVRVPRRGPNSMNSSVSALSANSSLPRGTVDPDMTSLLDGVAPSSYKKLTVEGGKGEAYAGTQGTILLRTPLTVLSPNWNAVVSSSDGMHVYQLVFTPVILASENGKTVQLTIKGQ